MTEQLENKVFASVMGYFVQSMYTGRMCLERCVDPLLLALGEKSAVSVDQRSSLRSEIAGFLDEFQSIGDNVQEWFLRDVLTDHEVSSELRARSSTIKHDLCNRIFEGVCLISCLRELLDALDEAGEDCSEMVHRVETTALNIKRWFDRISILDLVSFSDVEPAIFIRQRFKRLRLIVEDSIPDDVNRCTLNMILFHLVLNAQQHQVPGRELKIEVRQASEGISVTDNGTGIKTERMKEIEEAVKLGRAVKPRRQKVSGFGIYDSVILLRCLFNDSDRSKRAEMVVETLEGVGTRVAILWDLNGEREELFGDNCMRFSGSYDAATPSLGE